MHFQNKPFLFTTSIVLLFFNLSSVNAHGMNMDRHLEMDGHNHGDMSMDDDGHNHGDTGDSSTPDHFCHGSGLAMNHLGLGFSLGNHHRDCVNFLFEDWTLDTESKFIGAMFGTFFFAVLAEAIGYKHSQMYKSLSDDLKWKSTILSMMYGLQALIGFTLMLITMTFSVDLLLAVVAGLAVGHRLFNARGHVSRNFAMCHASGAEIYENELSLNVEKVCCTNDVDKDLNDNATNTSTPETNKEFDECCCVDNAVSHGVGVVSENDTEDKV